MVGMDQTELFRAVVKAVRLQLKAQREAAGSGTPIHLHLTKHTKKLTQFTASANDVVNKARLIRGWCVIGSILCQGNALVTL